MRTKDDLCSFYRPGISILARPNRACSTNVVSRVVDLLAVHRIKLDVLEHVLKETNPLVHEHNLGTIENLRARKAAEIYQVLTQTLESQPAES
jgi:hypothetical protein